MASGFVCSTCPRFAQHCCLCIPERVYCCEQCVSQHASKGGMHPLAPVTVPAWVTAFTLPVFNTRLSVGARLKGVLEELSGKLVTEKDTLSKAVHQRYEEQVKALSDAWELATTEIEEYFERVKRDIETLKEEISKLEANENVTLSTTAEKLLGSGLHDLPAHSFVDLAGEHSGKIQVSATPLNFPTANCLQLVLEAWNPSLCLCPDCSFARTILDSPTISAQFTYSAKSLESTNALKHWTLNNSKSLQCVPIAPTNTKIDDLSALQRGNPTCSLPVQQANRELQAVRRPGAAIATESPPSKAAKIDPLPDETQSECVKQCYYCHTIVSVCDRICHECGMSTVWTEYLEAWGVKLSPDRKSWKCAQCDNYNCIEIKTCVSCGLVNEVMQKGKPQMKKPSEGLFGIIGWLFG